MSRHSVLLKNRALQMVLLFTFALAAIGAGDTTAKFSNLGHKMVCTCGCGQILLECNHVGCPNSDGMIKELRTQVSSGGTDTSIFNYFVAKYGPTVLAAPIRGGFDNAAWIVPIVVFLLATVGTALLIRKWKGQHMLTAAGAPGTILDDNSSNDMRDRIRRETEF